MIKYKANSQKYITGTGCMTFEFHNKITGKIFLNIIFIPVCTGLRHIDECFVNDQIGCLINQSDVVRDVALVCFELNNLSHERITVRNATSQFLNSGRIPYLAILLSGKGHYTNPDT